LRSGYEKIKKDEHLFQGSESIGFKDFEIIKEIGRGAFGTVYKVKKKDTGVEYAMKCLKKRTLIKKNQLRYAVTECNVLKRANHPFILGLNFAF
jgi:serine/threonine protein kinase